MKKRNQDPRQQYKKKALCHDAGSERGETLWSHDLCWKEARQARVLAAPSVCIVRLDHERHYVVSTQFIQSNETTMIDGMSALHRGTNEMRDPNHPSS